VNSDPAVFIVGDGQSDLTNLLRVVELCNLRVQTYSSAGLFLEQYNPDHPGCVILYLPDFPKQGLEFQQRLASRGYDVPVIILSGGSDMAMAVQAMKAGAVSVLKTPVEPKLMLETIREAIDKDASTRRVNAQTFEIRKRLALLTRREHEVMELLIDGKANKEVAARLDLSEKTVEIHRSHVMKKMQVSSLASLVRFVLLAQGLRVEETWRGRD
jgi:FixJ family two-component response regulator